MRKVRILLESQPALSQLIHHLFRGRAEFEVVTGGSRQRPGKPRRGAPELIVASLKPVCTGVYSAVLAIKESSPASKLILICPIGGLNKTARAGGADACLDPEKLVTQLLPTAMALSEPARVRRA